MEQNFIVKRGIFKKAVDVAAKIVGLSSTNKGNEDIVLFTTEDNKLVVFSESEDGSVRYYHNVNMRFPEEDSEDLDGFAILVKYKEISKIIPSKSADILINIVGSSIQIDGESVSFVHFNEHEFHEIKPPEFKFRNDDSVSSDEIRELLLDVNDTINKDIKYLSVGNDRVLLQSPILVKRFTLPVDTGYDHQVDPSKFSILKRDLHWRKSDEKTISFGGNNESLGFRLKSSGKTDLDSFEQMFVFKDHNLVRRSMIKRDSVNVGNLSVDFSEFKRIVNMYKSDTQDVYISAKNGKLMVSDNNPTEDGYKEGSVIEDFDDVTIDYSGSEFEKLKVNLNSLKSFVTGYLGEVEFEVRSFEMDGELFKFLIVINKGVYSSVLLIKEPEFSEVQRKLDAIIERQKSIKYI